MPDSARGIGQAAATELHHRLLQELVDKGLLDDPRLHSAFTAVRREHFLPGVELERVYRDQAVETQTGPDGLPTSSSSQPAIMATMLAELDPQPGDRVLEVGAGTGYNAALLAHLVGPTGRVTTIDIDPAVSDRARANFERAGCGEGPLRRPDMAPIDVHTGDGWLGAPGEAPFDRIEVTVGVSDLAPAWRLQLASEGTLVVPLWLRAGLQAAVAFAHSNDDDLLRSRRIEPCGFMRLRGPHAGPEGHVEIRPGLLACVDDVEALDLTLLRTLLEGPSSRQPAPPLSEDLSWCTRLALEDPGAIAMFPPDVKEPAAIRGGIFDPSPSAPGLALVFVRDGELKAFGNTAPMDRLQRLLEEPHIPLATLRIEAMPTDTTPDPAGSESRGPGVWRLDRRAHRFLVWVDR